MIDRARRAVAHIVPAHPATGAPDRATVPLMDAMRAFAALAIVVFHLSDTYQWQGDLRPALRQLTIGVPIFFLISSFLLYRPFVVARLEGRPPPSLRRFARRRVLRIVPAFWVALTVAILIGSTIAATDAVRLYLFAQVYSPRTLELGLGQAWSLDVEILLYVLLGVVGWAVARRRPAGGASWRSETVPVLALLGLSVLIKAAVVAGMDLRDDADRWILYTLPWYLDHMAVGMLLAVWSAQRVVVGGSDRVQRVVESRAWLCWLGAAVGFALVVELAQGWPEEDGIVVRHHLRLLIAVLFLLPAIFGPADHGRLRRVVGSRPVLAVGVVSYSLYLWHTMVIGRVDNLLPFGVTAGAGALVGATVAIGASLVLAAGSYLVIELPALRYRSRDRVGPVPHAGAGAQARSEAT